MCKDTKLYIISSNGDFSSTIIVGSVTKKEFEELQYVLNKSFDCHSMDAKEIAMDLVIAGYGKIIELQKQCNTLTDDNKALQSSIDMYVLKCLSLQREMEELKNANSKRN